MPNTEASRNNADAALSAYITAKQVTGDILGDDRENVTDLITDLLQLVDSDPERFDEHDGGMIQDTAIENYYAERDGDDVGTDYDPNAGCPSLVSSEDHDARRSGA